MRRNDAVKHVLYQVCDALNLSLLVAIRNSCPHERVTENNPPEMKMSSIATFKAMISNEISDWTNMLARGARWAIVAGATIGAASMSPANASTGPLQGEDLRHTISGHTVLLNTGMGFEVPISYRSNGSMSGRVQAFAAAMAGESRPQDSGRWWVTEKQLCQRWSNWLDRKTYCFDLVRKGGTIYWRTKDGMSGTARIR